MVCDKINRQPNVGARLIAPALPVSPTHGRDQSRPYGDGRMKL